MANKFYPGQPVICINDDFRHTIRKYNELASGITWPVRGRRYVVRSYAIARVKYPSVLLMEIKNRRVPYADGIVREAGFWDERFEPATENQVQAIIAMAMDMPESTDIDITQPTPREIENV